MTSIELVPLAGTVERGHDVSDRATGVESSPALRKAGHVIRRGLVIYDDARIRGLAFAESLNLLTQPVSGSAHAIDDGRCT